MNYVEEIAKIIGVQAKDIVVTVSTPQSFECKSQQGHFLISNKGSGVALFDLICMPGCCGILVSCKSEVFPQYRNKGLGKLLNNMRYQIAQEWGYSVLLCTDVESNQPQQKILSQNGWTHLMSFKNARTANKVSMHEKIIDLKNQPTDELGFVLPNRI